MSLCDNARATAGYKIGVASQRTGLSPATLRLWEEQYGLLDPARTEGRTRIYSESDIARATLIRRLVRTSGQSLRGMRAILDNPDADLRQSLEYLAQLETSGSVGLAAGAREARGLFEDAQLRDATSRDRIRDAGTMTQGYGILTRLAQAEDFDAAVAVLLAGVRELTGAQRSLLGLYDAETDTIHIPLRHLGRQVRPTGYQPWRVSELRPVGWRLAIINRRSFLEPEIRADDVPAQAAAETAAAGLGSFYSSPLLAGSRLVGILIIASRHGHGISAEARVLCDRLAGPAGPVIAYFRDRMTPAGGGIARQVLTPSSAW